MLNIVIFGAPGSGKGTQSALIAQRYNLVHCSTGDLLRAEIAAGTPLGKQVQEVISKGQLVSDELIIDLLMAEIDRHKEAKGFIFDGFPRTIVQAAALDTMLQRYNEKVTLMLSMFVEKEELIKRLVERGKQSGRADDNIDTIRQRINVYDEKTAPVMHYYQQRGLYNAINNDGSVEEAFEQVCQVVDKHI